MRTGANPSYQEMRVGYTLDSLRVHHRPTYRNIHSFITFKPVVKLSPNVHVSNHILFKNKSPEKRMRSFLVAKKAKVQTSNQQLTAVAQVTHLVLHSQDDQVTVGVRAGRGLQRVVVPPLPAAVALTPFPAPCAGLPPFPAPCTTSSTATSSSVPTPCTSTTSSPSTMPLFPTPTSTHSHTPAPTHRSGSAIFPTPSSFACLLPPLPAPSNPLPF